MPQKPLPVVSDHLLHMLDSEANVSSWNPGSEAITGYKAREVLGKPSSIFYTDDAIAGGKPGQALTAAMKYGSYREEAWRVRKDGTECLADVLLTALQDSDGTDQPQKNGT